MPSKLRKSLNKNKIICLNCNTQVLESEEAIQCDNCQKTLHSLCTKLDKKQYDALVNDATLEYKCHFCVPNKSVSVCANDLTEINTKLNQLTEIKETINFMSSQYDAILKGVAKNTKQIKTLKKQNDTLREEVKNLKSTVKYLNDCRVLKDVIINGIEVDDKKTAVEVVLDVAKKTGADICEDEVEEAYFLNRRKQNNKKEDKTTSLVVKFTNKKSKNTFMQEKSKMKEIEGLKKVYVNDFLCKETLQLLSYAKSLKSVGFKYVYAKTGNIFAKKDEKSRQIRLNSVEDVDDLLCKSAGGARKRNILAEIENIDDVDDEDDDDSQFESPN